jgi:hypothetical protein
MGPLVAHIAASITGRARYLAQRIGNCREALVEADKALAALYLGQMQRIGEILPASRQSNARPTTAGSSSLTRGDIVAISARKFRHRPFFGASYVR